MFGKEEKLAKGSQKPNIKERTSSKQIVIPICKLNIMPASARDFVACQTHVHQFQAPGGECFKSGRGLRCTYNRSEETTNGDLLRYFKFCWTLCNIIVIRAVKKWSLSDMPISTTSQKLEHVSRVTVWMDDRLSSSTLLTIHTQQIEERTVQHRCWIS